MSGNLTVIREPLCSPQPRLSRRSCPCLCRWRFMATDQHSASWLLGSAQGVGVSLQNQAGLLAWAPRPPRPPGMACGKEERAHQTVYSGVFRNSFFSGNTHSLIGSCQQDAWRGWGREAGVTGPASVLCPLPGAGRRHWASDQGAGGDPWAGGAVRGEVVGTDTPLPSSKTLLCLSAKRTAQFLRENSP